jgi:hypothetical protein
VNKLEEQTNVLEKIAQIVHLNAVDGYDKACCIFDISFSQDGSSSVGEAFSFQKNGTRFSEFLRYTDKEIPSLVRALHTMMKAHTGGEWTSFTLTLDQDGKAHTKFHYPEPEA